MARKKQNGSDPIVEAIRELGRNLGGRIDQTNERLDQTNERLDQTNERLGRLENGFARVEGAIEELRRTDERLGERIDRTNDRIDVLAQATALGFARMETRLDEIVRNTGSHYRELGERVGALEAWRRTQE